MDGRGLSTITNKNLHITTL